MSGVKKVSFCVCSVSAELVGGLPLAFMEGRFLILTASVEFCLSMFCRTIALKLQCLNSVHTLLKATKAVVHVVVLLKRLLNMDQLLEASLPFSLSLSLHLSPSPLPVRMGCAFRGHITYLLTYRT